MCRSWLKKNVSLSLAKKLRNLQELAVESCSHQSLYLDGIGMMPMVLIWKVGLDAEMWQTVQLSHNSRLEGQAESELPENFTIDKAAPPWEVRFWCENQCWNGNGMGGHWKKQCHSCLGIFFYGFRMLEIWRNLITVCPKLSRACHNWLHRWCQDAKYTGTVSWRAGRMDSSWFCDELWVCACYIPRKLTWQWKTHHEWRCISYWKWGFSNVILVFRGVI